MKQIAIVGIQGVPAKYGGFESLVENIIGENCPPEIHYTVFCSRRDYTERKRGYKGASLKYIPWFHANGIQSTLYDICGLLLSLRGYDCILVLGVSGCIFLPVFRLLCRKRLVVNIDGLEHRRAKWGRFAKWFLRKSEAMAVRCADVVVADNNGIQDYVRETYGKESALVAYGGDQVLRKVSEEKQLAVLQQYGVESGKFAVSVCRIEPENNSHIILEAFAQTDLPLVFIGNWEHSEYGRRLKEKYAGCAHIRMMSANYDLDMLYSLRNHCRCYIHGHSAGGTNPSLVEAMFFGKPILAYDVVYNRETTENKAYYFKSAKELVGLLGRHLENGEALKEVALKRYTWKYIAKQYEDFFTTSA